MQKHKKEVGTFVRPDGVSFRVWAPHADKVGVHGSWNWDEQALKSEGDGYWSLKVHEARAGQEYKFIIHVGENVFERNDPRALHFTTTNGNSVIATSSFDWGDTVFEPIPTSKQVIYELHVGTFYRPDAATTGTFADVIAKLDYLKDLGINMIELMPISNMFMDRGWGYALDYIFSVETLYGGRYGFQQFVKAAHERGIGVILDVVYNHFGPDTAMDLWRFDGWYEDDKGGIYFYNDWRAETPWGNTRPNFDDPDVQNYILDNVQMWLRDCRVDGLRFDSTIYIRNVKGQNDAPDTDLAAGWSLLQQANRLAHKINPDVVTIAEDIAWNEHIVKGEREGGASFDAQWELGWPSALRKALNSSNVSNIDLYDLVSELTKSYNGHAYARVNFVDSHDSAANGSARFNEVVSPGFADSQFAARAMVIATALILTVPGVPMIFQGQEFLQGGAFNDWEALDFSRADKHRDVLDAHKRLIALRTNKDGLTAGLHGNNINVLNVDNDNKVIAYHRWNLGGVHDDVVVIVNLGDHEFDDYKLHMPRDGEWKLRFANAGSANAVAVANGQAKLTVPARSVLIFSQD